MKKNACLWRQCPQFHYFNTRSFPGRQWKWTSVTSPQYSPSAWTTIGRLKRIVQSLASVTENPWIDVCFAATKNGRHRNVLHFGIPAASQNDNFPSQADAAGAIGTPPPSALKFVAAVKIILCFCNPSSRSKKISASAVCNVNNDCSVSTRYVRFPSRILFRISLIVDVTAFLQTN